ncbi:uncharacterized protein LOC142632694 [Castanea sativa]|uniref:uncharacterized protein LOC142632694 n=1 Tax=Castanea sativa TaxID=21020 RepID=UPI003F650EE3
MGAMSKKLHFPLGAIEAEAKAVEEGALLAWDLGLKDVIIESDSLAMVQALNGVTSPAISVQKIVEGVSWWLKKFDKCKVSHTGRSSNIAAHVMAKEAKLILESVIWVEDSPPVIADQLMYDVLSMDSCPNL